MSEKPCSHLALTFQSGDYYVFCPECKSQWVRKDPTSGTDEPSPGSANKQGTDYGAISGMRVKQIEHG